MEKVVYIDKQYNDRKELIRPLERCAKKFNKETIMSLYKLSPGHLLEVIDVKTAEIQLRFDLSSNFFFFVTHMSLLSGSQNFGYYFHAFLVIYFNFEILNTFGYSYLLLIVSSS